MSTDDSDRPEEASRERLENETGEFENRLVDLLAWVLDTETRALIYLQLRRQPDSTSREIAEGTDLYPSTVREALADLHGDGIVGRTKREAPGAGNNPYEYRAISPRKLVGRAVEEAQGDLNTLFHLDEFLGGDGAPADPTDGPVTIEMQTGSPGASTPTEAVGNGDRDSPAPGP